MFDTLKTYTILMGEESIKSLNTPQKKEAFIKNLKHDLKNYHIDYLYREDMFILYNIQINYILKLALKYLQESFVFATLEPSTLHIDIYRIQSDIKEAIEETTTQKELDTLINKYMKNIEDVYEIIDSAG